MKKTIFSILLTSLLFSCDNKSNEKEQKLTNQPTTVEKSDSIQNTSLKIEIEEFSKEEIPESIEIKGDLLIAKRWKDNNGENILILSRKGPIKETEYEVEFSGDERYAELYGAQYVKKNNEYELLWDIYDFERHCPFDLWIGCLPKSTQITDLDNDGITETTIIYKLTCRSDMSPSNMKLIMHENDTKMALRGTMILEIDKGRITDDFEYDLSKVDTTNLSDYERISELFGRYSNENDFNEKPAVFLEFAKKSWVDLVDKDGFEQL